MTKTNSIMNSPHFAPEPIDPIPFLDGLRVAVLDRSTKRFPKWRFRLAEDLVLQMQPRPHPKELFDCLALQGSDLTADSFGLRRHRSGSYAMQFSIVPDGTRWSIRPGRYSWPRDSSPDATLELRTRITALLQRLEFDGLSPDMLLRPACLICGKALTDPASMARMIGPECAGTASLTVPWLLEMEV